MFMGKSKFNWGLVFRKVLYLYFPVYLVGIVAITLTRILLAFCYIILLDFLPAKNIIRNLFNSNLDLRR